MMLLGGWVVCWIQINYDFGGLLKVRRKWDAISYFGNLGPMHVIFSVSCFSGFRDHFRASSEAFEGASSS